MNIHILITYIEINMQHPKPKLNYFLKKFCSIFYITLISTIIFDIPHNYFVTPLISDHCTN